MNSDRRLLLWASAGLVGAAASMASAQPYVINIAGATLLENFVSAPASTNDFIDVDGNGICGDCDDNNEQLADSTPSNPYAPGMHWIVTYRLTGSVRGFGELVRFGDFYVTSDDPCFNMRAIDPMLDIASCETTRTYCNRNRFIDNGVPATGFFNGGNPGGFPVRSTMDGTFLATTYVNPNNPSAGGAQIDVAPVDVPSFWATNGPDTLRGGSSAAPDALPGEPGYGRNPTISVNKDGTSAGFGHQLVNLGDRNLFDPMVTPDANTIFDTQLAFAPIACVTNLGTGVREATYTEIRHLFATGRANTGENFIVVTRDSGSGTRNGFNNTTCLDPSWGVGDNIGGLSNQTAQHRLGLEFRPSNKNGNSDVENTVINHRLAIGYAGAERGVNGSAPGSWLSTGRMECLGVRNDDLGGTVFARPHIDRILDNDANGYNIGGPAILATLGDPRAEGAALGGDSNGNPQMRNEQAAAYVNNVSRSVAEFTAVPGGDPSLFAPGELAATIFALTASLDNLHSNSDPCTLIVNPVFNANLQTFTRNNSVLGSSAYLTFGSVTLNGLVPNRTDAASTYSDQTAPCGACPGGVNAAGVSYINQGGVLVSDASTLTNRNRIAGDFSGNGERDINDISQMIAAWRARNGGPAWVAPNGTGPIAGAPGTDAIIEVLGDFDGNGSFNTEDVRFFADGLAMVTAVTVQGGGAGGTRSGLVLDREQGFTQVDVQVGGNFFGTTLANPGATYSNGDSRADIAASDGLQTPNFAPLGADGAVNSYDIDYVYKNFKSAPFLCGQQVDWSVLTEAVGKDLSADIDGNLLINQADVTEVVEVILEAEYGDVTLDGVVDSIDYAIIDANQGMSGGWGAGDMNGDGTVNADDRAIVITKICPGNATKLPGVINFGHVLSVLANFGNVYCFPNTGEGDADGSGTVNFTDVLNVLSNFGVPCL